MALENARVIVGKSPLVSFPDAEAHGLPGHPEPAYDVRFDTRDLWPEASDEVFVHATVFHGTSKWEFAVSGHAEGRTGGHGAT